MLNYSTKEPRHFRLGALVFVLFGLGFAGVLNAKTLVFQSQSEPSPDRPLAPAESPVQPEPTPTVLSAAASSANSELFFMLEQLQQEVRTLRGMLEEQANQINQMQSSGKSRYRDIDSRVLDLSKKMALLENVSGVANAPTSSQQTNSGLAGMNPGPAVSAVAPSTGAGLGSSVGKDASPPSEAQKKQYQQAYSLIKEKKFEEAIERLHAFIERYPEGELAGNAYYWLGEVYLVLPKLDQARASFSIVVSSFSGHRKAADAMFKLGVTYDRLQDPAQSEKYLNEVQAKFPESTAARLAKSYKINR